MAFATYTLLLWTAFELMNPDKKAKQLASQISQQAIKAAKTHRSAAILSGALVATTVLSGAYVAGNDAGNAFNTWPDMDGRFIPEDLFPLEPKWRNFVENTPLVQFDHRMLAYSSFAAIWANYLPAVTSSYFSTFPAATRIAFHSTAAMSVAQVGLGISAILLYVPLPIAVSHQAGSLVLLTLVTRLAHTLKFSRFTGATATATTAAKLVK
jgi:cytochrome c oxidase assembly protein subunit 15